MKTIYQSQDVAFHAPTLKDAVILLPLMDSLSQMININRVANLYESLPREEREKYKRVWIDTRLQLPPESAEKIWKVLTDLGFESQFELREVTMDDLELK